MDRVDQILQRFVAQGDDTKDKLAGAAFVVTDRKGVIYSGSAGRVDLPGTSASFTDKSFSWVASLTKLLTSTCVMQLVEQGVISLDEDLRPKIPELKEVKILLEFDVDDKPVFQENTKPITLRQLLTHTAGFAYEFTDATLLKWCRADGRNVRQISWSKKEITTPLRFEPGEFWGYGVNTDWVGQVLEAVTGRTLGSYMQEHIFDPLGMADTGFHPDKLPQTMSRTVKTIGRNKKTGNLEPSNWAPPTEHEIESGGGGLYTTASDYARFLRGLLQGRLLSKSTMKDIMKPQLNKSQSKVLAITAFHPSVKNTFAPEFPVGTKISHGLAGMVNLEDVPGKRRAKSMAWSGIHNSRWWLDPKSGIAAVLIVNVRPHGDATVAKLYDELELAVYKHILPFKGKL